MSNAAPAPCFGLAHATYRAFRPAYPSALYDRLIADLEGGLGGGRSLAVDLGAGTGLVSAALIGRFDRVIAVEPDPDMAGHLRELADASPSFELQGVAAEQAEFEHRSVDLITCANALYWMDAPRVLAQVGRWLRPGGRFAAWRYLFPKMPVEIAEVFAREMAERWSPFRDERVRTTGATRQWIDDEPQLECVADESFPNIVTMSAAQLVGFAASTSFGAAYLRSLSPVAAARYLAGLEQQLTDISAGASVEMDLELTLVTARLAG